MVKVKISITLVVLFCLTSCSIEKNKREFLIGSDSVNFFDNQISMIGLYSDSMKVVLDSSIFIISKNPADTTFARKKYEWMGKRYFCGVKATIDQVTNRARIEKMSQSKYDSISKMMAGIIEPVRLKTIELKRLGFSFHFSSCE